VDVILKAPKRKEEKKNDGKGGQRKGGLFITAIGGSNNFEKQATVKNEGKGQSFQLPFWVMVEGKSEDRAGEGKITSKTCRGQERLGTVGREGGGKER